MAGDRECLAHLTQTPDLARLPITVGFTRRKWIPRRSARDFRIEGCMFATTLSCHTVAMLCERGDLQLCKPIQVRADPSDLTLDLRMRGIAVLGVLDHIGQREEQHIW